MSSRQRDSFNQINITPLTDIFLVLLIIMMVVAPMLDQQGLNLAVPSSKEVEKIDKNNKIIYINVSDDDSYTYEGKKVSGDNLIYTLKDATKEKKDGLLIQASSNSTHGAVVKIMDAARNVGILNVSIAEN
jgi:biopolymer transport protein ExbD/biopolymer transport protein TolR